tara:strand:+ start:134 stop:268 length:135 start_codon:yes stop_codon:yes gene_type:complete
MALRKRREKLMNIKEYPALILNIEEVPFIKKVVKGLLAKGGNSL